MAQLWLASLPAEATHAALTTTTHGGRVAGL
jgi:hypothetical protein